MPAQIPLEELRKVGPQIAQIEGYLPSSYPRYIEWEDIKEPETIQYTSPEAIHSYCLTALRAMALTLGKYGAIPKEAADEIVQKANRYNIPWKKADEWEKKLRHDIRGLVRAAQEVLSVKARFFFYLGPTSYDVINTAQSMALRDVTYEVIEPKGIEFARVLIERARKEVDTVLIGRTHRQHAAATTAGHWLGEILEGFMFPLVNQLNVADNLRGKLSGFVGTRAAQKLLFGKKIHPKKLEFETLCLLHLQPDRLTGQVVHQSYYNAYFDNLINLAGELYKFGEDIRSFQQTEVGEVYEQRLPEQVGSSTGAHKRNPIISEQIGGHWRQILPKIISVHMDSETNWQRDLRDSSNKRYYMSEIPFIAYHMLRRAKSVAEGMTIRREKMAQNLGITQGLILGEPLQLLLQTFCAYHGMPIDTHEYVRRLTDKAQESNKPFWDVIKEDSLVEQLLSELDEETKLTLLSPEKYIGTVKEDVEERTKEWEVELNRLEEKIEKHKIIVKYP